MTPWQRLNPRLHLAAAIGWAVFAVVTLAALAGANLAAAQAERRARADAQALLVEFATQVRDALSMNIEIRRSLLQATAAQIAATTDRRPAALQRILHAVQAQYPEFSRLVVVDAKGRAVATTAAEAPADDHRVSLDTGRPGGPGRVTPPVDLSGVLWFTEGRRSPFVSDLNARPGVVSTAAGERAASRVIDMAVPLRIGPGDGVGVLAAEVPWVWVERLLGRMEDAFTAHRPLELLLASRDGTLLAGPPPWLGRPFDGVDLSEGGRQVLGRRTQLRLADSLGFGWTVVVRQPTDVALQAVRSTRQMVFLIVFLAGLLSAAGAMAVTRVLTRGLSQLAVDAEAVRRGERRSLSAPPGADEVSRIGATLAVVVDHLQAEKQSLQALNADLDQRVAERTTRIERMADEARHAAVTRERLRIARDLHDTLAHSLMALLTQIRLVRKLHRRMDAGELEDELGRAEGVAATGLADARAAIGQMRDNGVRDTGLTPALHDLARRFRQRSGVELALVSQGPAQDWADERAETVFRIVEEALRNVERHAQARKVVVTLHWSAPQPQAAQGDGGRLHVEVIDDGVGFDTVQPQGGHYGLRGMHEQAALIEARLVVASQPGQGTRVALDCQP
ncbi:MAG: hypothetical protein RL375_2863 [Pseudomonadota bacterium]